MVCHRSLAGRPNERCNMGEKNHALKLLVIDDSPQNLELITGALAQKGLQILTASDPEAGFEIFLRARPQIVLVDLVMPKMSGMELLEQNRRSRSGTDVILMTGQYSAESAVEAIQKGACDYLTKPLDLEKLRHRIRSLLEDAERRQQAFQLDRELVDAFQFEGMIGRSPLILETFARIRRVAPHFQTRAGFRCNRYRQRVGGASSPSSEPQGFGTVRGLQLLGAGGDSSGERTLRLRPRSVHWRQPGQDRNFRAGQRRYRFSGRNRRLSSTRASQAASCACSNGRCSASARRRLACCRCPRDRGHQSPTPLHGR